MLPQKIKIGIVDDHTLIRSALAQTINSFGGCEVTLQADNGTELLDVLNTHNMHPDICVVDINMPIMNGFDTVIELKKNYADIKVIILTEYCTDYAIVRAIQSGANAYLLKTCDLNELSAAINVLTNSSFFYSELVTNQFYIKALKQILPVFSSRELEFLQLCCRNLKYVEIAKKMYVGQRTVENYYNTISKKLNITNKSSLIAYAKDSGLVYCSHVSGDKARPANSII